MLDEVNGRRFQVRKYLDEGTPLECRQTGAVRALLHRAVLHHGRSRDRAPEPGELERLVDRRSQRTRSQRYADAGGERAAVRVPVHRPRGRRSAGRRGPRRRSRTSASTSDRSAPPDWSIGRACRTACCSVSASRSSSTSCSSGTPLPAGVEVEIELNQRTAPWLLSQRERVRTYLDVIRLHQPSHEFLKDAVANDVRDLKRFFTELALPIRTSGLTACLAPGTQLVEAPKVLEKKMFDPETGRIAIRELARTHVVHGYQAKSLRCRDCRRERALRGRAHQLHPRSGIRGARSRCAKARGRRTRRRSCSRSGRRRCRASATASRCSRSGRACPGSRRRKRPRSSR